MRVRKKPSLLMFPKDSEWDKVWENCLATCRLFLMNAHYLNIFNSYFHNILVTLTFINPNLQCLHSHSYLLVSGYNYSFMAIISKKYHLYKCLATGTPNNRFLNSIIYSSTVSENGIASNSRWGKLVFDEFPTFYFNFSVS